MTAARDDGPFDPQTGLQAFGCHAAFSGPHTIAAALLDGGLGASHEDFTDAVARDSRRLALAALLRCVEDERCSASFRYAFPAALRVTTRTGEELEARVAARTLALPDAQSAEDLTALLTSAGERRDRDGYRSRTA
ncbi:hypothetical protein GCM10022403_010410 [Streptomyces coacervatus]|uniref:MmgE/PrpD C-terminal domain-containing protein n=1 Tax=Streptomyces coacervatus TaxID=647381 RepID=A0ABP7GXH7_9ACTN|nr:hypothetical protein [Streptomyces coacervatus]MDF2268193.1 hypothetical protein [Streptomyces coacervatus]